MIYNMNKRLTTLLEVNLFPVILEATILHEMQPEKYPEFVMSLKGFKRKNFIKNSLTKHFEKLKSRILLG